MQNEAKKNTRKITGKSAFPLRWIYFHLTEGCNLACRHCWINPKFQIGDTVYPSLPFELFQSIIEEARPLGLNAVKLTGGEPLMHPQIKEILDWVRKEELKINIETNAALCTAELAEKISRCKNPFVAVSLDGDAQTHEYVRGVEGCFDDAVNGIKELVNAGLRPQIIMSVMRCNKEQIEDVVRVAESLKAASVKFNIVQPTGRGEKMKSGGETLPVDELLELGRWVDNNLAPSTNIKLFYSYPPAFRPLSGILGKNGDGCFTCGIMSILGVLSDGSYALCGIGTTVPELVFGNATTDSLTDVWNKNKVLVELREGSPDRFEGICGSCLMKKLCIGSCIAQNYYRAGNIWAPFWFCDEAYQKGLFPETRISPATR